VDRRAARPSTRAPDRDIPPELDDLCARATAYASEDRVQTARELATAIEQYLEGDRDLERRREQARGHALAAREASRRAAGGGPDALAARREALREAGRAVALDPEGREGLRAAVELMLEPPKEVPAEVRDELDRAQADRIRAGIRTGVVVFGAFMAAALGVPVIAGPLDWSVPLLIALALSAAVLVSVIRLRARQLATRSGSTLVTAFCVCMAIALAAAYLGPMMLVPPLVVALTNALVVSHLRWRPVLLMSVLAVTIPFALEWAALVPTSYEFRSDGIFVRPVVMSLSELPVRIGTLLVTLCALVGSTLYLRRVILVETDLRKKWVLHNWYLRQLARVEE
jgi:serine/threonine-protein kinase